ncbi:histone deacetylase family protein [Methylovirgula sp. 4M-Z18]|uniref:histone deacetylase family protein n=1 Tax=Methylovirgula sp. 4M-Z18 TaxID=2293567 RepID=UPI000E2EF355|nr:histone deacetylase family protein [Methylovirgula sp. 4M-Z18]RFB80139.1 histone deacetylase family protein [Methylovirgula sp. 4M-Z18]
MSTLLLTHDICLAHDMGPGHPERPDRLRAIHRALANPRFDRLVREEAPLAELAAVQRAHPTEYLEALEEAVPTQGLVRLDSDTALNPHSWQAAMRAAGGAIRAVDAVMSGAARNAFVATRPPGHHAERTTPMGFCFINHVAIAARHAQATHGAERVAIIDFDVHHGNGTQDIFWNDGSVLYASTHEMPLYPGTGARQETGAHNNIVNAPLRAGDGSAAFHAAMNEVILPRVAGFAPDLIVVSAGFDAHRRDPLGNLNLDEADFAWITLRLMELADVHARGRLVSVLEGGYDLQGLAASTAAHVEALMAAG